MGKVQNGFGNGAPGAVSRSIDNIIISIKNASGGDIAFGAPVFMTENGAVPFNIDTPQDFTTFLGFAVRVEDKTPKEYPTGQFNDASSAGEAGAWHANDVMEVLVRGTLAVSTTVSGSKGGGLYIRKTDGKMTGVPGSSGTTVQLENCHIRNPRNGYGGTAEVVVNERNIL